MRWVFRSVCTCAVLAGACTPDDSTGLILEICDNGLDDDGNGALDCDDPRCSSAQNCLARASCGDGVRSGGEFCDGADLGGATCETQGFLTGVGILDCREDCAGFDTSDCVRADLCGNGVREGGESCDGGDFGASSCMTAGFAEGVLSCDDQCQLVTSGCAGVNPCGNGTLDAGEICDGEELAAASCASLGLQGDGLACNMTCDGYDRSACGGPELCGNGRVDAGELCDSIPEGRTCADEGFASGVLGCTPTCDAYITTQCSRCGNGVVDAGEVCDGSQVGANSCELEGFFTGTLRCNSQCDGFDTGDCGNCGNGVLDNGEFCDGDPEPAVTCADVGYQAGRLGCRSDCQAYATELCTGFSECGNGALDGADREGPLARLFQEFCEPAGEFYIDPVNLERFPLLDGCDDFAAGTGSVACNADCTLDFTGCSLFPPSATSFCELRGDFVGVCNPCDRIDGQADPDCQPLTDPTCGDGTADGELEGDSATSPFDWCDGDDLREQNCTTLGFAGGTLRCRDDCNFDTSQCDATECGDGIIQGREQCEGVLGTGLCSDFDPLFTSGMTTCNSSCFLDLTNCEE
ncbi:MAG: hypothetical protein AAF654_04895 [Myxococcota bacterium]